MAKTIVFGAFFFSVLFLCLRISIGSESSQKDLKTLHDSRDIRLGNLRHLDLYFPFQPVQDIKEWKLRSTQLRHQVQLAIGLFPYPPRTPLNSIIHGKVQRMGYTVEKVYFQSFPGHFVTGNLYRPSGSGILRPGVLSPHGHVKNGRFHDHGINGIRDQINKGEEHFEVGGRHPMQARAVQLARMGCVVFQYDMVGYGDSIQLSHKGLGPRLEMNTVRKWGFSSPRAELHLQSLMLLQTWNSIRALDFLISLSDVNPEQIAVEGHSGGGTQAFILAALDTRPTVVFPAVMVSTSMQGGCICENSCYLRIGAGNVDFAALSAPRPLGMTGANDWTHEIQAQGLPDLKKVYEFYGVPDLVMAEVFPQFEHNYNSVSREVMYGWLNRHLNLNHSEPVVEQNYIPLTRKEMSVWNHEHPPPYGKNLGNSHERYLIDWLTQEFRKQMEELWPRDLKSYKAFRSTIGQAFDVILGRNLKEVSQVKLQIIDSSPKSSKQPKDLMESVGAYQWQRGLLSNQFSEKVRILTWKTSKPANRTVIWITGEGSQELSAPNNEPHLEVKRLLRGGVHVISADLLGQGPQSENSNLNKNRFVSRIRDSDPNQALHHHAAYTFGYNYPLFTQRVHDVLTIMSYVKTEWPQSSLELVGLGPVAGPIAVAARAQSGKTLQKTAINTSGFRFLSINDFKHAMFLPGAVRYLDLPGLLVLPKGGGDLWLTGESTGQLSIITDAYRASGNTSKLVTLPPNKNHILVTSVVDWLLEK